MYERRDDLGQEYPRNRWQAAKRHGRLPGSAVLPDLGERRRQAGKMYLGFCQSQALF
jgi:hypothetical protein